MSIVLVLQWKIGGDKYDTGSYAQGFAQWQTTQDENMWDGVKCTAEYNSHNNGSSDNFSVMNYKDVSSMSVADAGRNGKWNTMGTPVPESEYQMFMADDNLFDPSITYAREYRSSNSYQTCTAGALLMRTVDGEAENDDVQELNDMYWTLRDSPALNVLTGFRLWEDPSDDKSEYEADGGTISYRLHDFGIEKPLPAVIIPDESEMSEGSGAFALASATATTIAAMMLL